MANVPEVLSFKLLDEETGHAVPNIATLLTLFARRKNDYHIGPRISDEQGVITFTRTDCLDEIEHSQQAFLMDYASSLEECLPKIELEVFSEEQISRLIKARIQLKGFFQNYWDCSEEFMNRLKKCDTHFEYRGALEEPALWQPGPLILTLKRRKSRKPEPR